MAVTEAALAWTWSTVGLLPEPHRSEAADEITANLSRADTSAGTAAGPSAAHPVCDKRQEHERRSPGKRTPNRPPAPAPASQHAWTDGSRAEQTNDVHVHGHGASVRRSTNCAPRLSRGIRCSARSP